MAMNAQSLFIPFATPGEPWAVRRAHSVLETYATREEAVMGAFGFAAQLSARMQMDVRIQIQESNGAWHALSPVHQRRSARHYAALARAPAERKKKA